MVKKISIEFAEILGLLCAEGSHIISFSNYWEKFRGKLRYRKNKKSERIEFYNKDLKLLCHYQDLLLREFAHSTNITKHGKINLGKKEIINKIIGHTKIGHLQWRVPPSVMNSDFKMIKLRFLRGYFDGDGTASGTIRMFTSNPIGAREISKLLSQLTFKHTIQGPIIRKSRKPSYVIQISRKEEEKFLKRVDPISKLQK